MAVQSEPQIKPADAPVTIPLLSVALVSVEVKVWIDEDCIAVPRGILMSA